MCTNLNLKSASDDILCTTRNLFLQRDLSVFDYMFAQVVACPNAATKGGQLFTDSIDARTTCFEKPKKPYLMQTSPSQKCDKMWVPTKNRMAPPLCPRPDGGNMNFVPQPKKDFKPAEIPKYC